MGKGKRGRRGPRTEPVNRERQQQEEARLAPPQPRFQPWNYLIINVFFWLFCFVQRHLAAWWIGEDVGLNFFFFTIACAFTLVSVFTFVHDLFYPEPAEEDLSGSP